VPQVGWGAILLHSRGSINTLLLSGFEAIQVLFIVALNSSSYVNICSDCIHEQKKFVIFRHNILIWMFENI
jgi:hypothetical protein